ncbi:MAG: radical SAM family heme chaperone HemW [Candidatus Accumulibacter sp.]|jgi:oxygen-independent coproporphyrinogen-3 oxidase|nr:radical SAM family heme chaperone HemW [Accumulibacter sp.]
MTRREISPVEAPGALEFSTPPPLSLYVHVPWCVKKCPYCDFNSYPLRGGLPEAEYVAALAADLESALPLVQGRRIVSVFFGGGTPSLLSAAGLDALLSIIRARVPLPGDAEITLEANPGTVDTGKFAAFRDAGITRLSLGVQSFDPEHLRTLGRIHDAGQARRAAAFAARDFDNFNLDLMYGLPGQTVAQALADVKEALTFSPTHLSCYQLAIEPDTTFAVSPPALPDPERCADMQEAIEAGLDEAGFIHYETSAFARPERQCRHNLNYWTFGDYLGIGAGAHGKLTLRTRNAWEVRRQMRWKHPKRYLAEMNADPSALFPREGASPAERSDGGTGNPLQDEFSVAADDLPFEFMMNALRLNEGFDAALFGARTAQPLSAVETILRRAESEGLLVRDAGRIAPTRRGQRFLNRLLEMFLA